MVTKDFWVLLAMVIYFVAMLTIGFILLQAVQFLHSSS